MTYSENDTLRWREDCIHWQGKVLVGEHAHYCWDWDGLPIDETTVEYRSCVCYRPDEDDGDLDEDHDQDMRELRKKQLAEDM